MDSEGSSDFSGLDSSDAVEVMSVREWRDESSDEYHSSFSSPATLSESGNIEEEEDSISDFGDDDHIAVSNWITRLTGIEFPIRVTERDFSSPPSPKPRCIVPQQTVITCLEKQKMERKRLEADEKLAADIEETMSNRDRIVEILVKLPGVDPNDPRFFPFLFTD